MTQEPVHTSRCPSCCKDLRWRDFRELPYFPFCSERCKLVDLGRWLVGNYRIDGDESAADEDEDPEKIT